MSAISRFFVGILRLASLPSFVLFMPATLLSAATPETHAPVPVGVAQVDITPDYPVRLSGFGFRRDESEGVTQRIWAKALAIGDEREGPAVLITTDNLGVPIEMIQELEKRLAGKIGLKPHRLSITATHTHTAPMLKNVAPTLFGTPIPPEHQSHIDRYTREFVDKLESVAITAIKDIRPGRLSWGIGTAGFAINRRTKGGPVDHDLPLLVVRDLNGKIRALYFSYACHCVTLSHNKISGDWAGYALEAVQKLHPDAIALASVGCGADSNPSSGVTGDKFDTANDQGKQIATEIDRLLAGSLQPLTARPISKWTVIDLEFATPRTRAEWEERAKRNDAIGHHARVNLARLDQGETLPTRIHYPIQTWLFGEQLAMVFLPGEVVVDYSLRLKRELDRSRLWINAYANDAPCYIPSERVLKEGGYEGGDAMIYYDRPQKFAPGLEQKIIDVIHGQIPKTFEAPRGTEGTTPKSGDQALGTMRAKPGLRVELAAAQPLIHSPVAIDWDAAGHLWVCEMFDYPSGTDENWQVGGRVSRLRDTNGDGRFDESTVFLDGLPFPTGLMVWGRGVLVCAAPNILWAQDTNGDGKADKVETLFSGFAADNYQARVNSLSLGLDNWIYGANGLLGGKIKGPSGEVDIRGHDFRFPFPKGAMETVNGITQQGRVRDDWDRWFGCDNGTALTYFPHEVRYFRRNPHFAAPLPAYTPFGNFDIGRVYPQSPLLERFNDPETANRLTSACGLGIYRDTLLGEEYYQNAFTCEPVHNLVHRMVIEEQDLGLRQLRAPDEAKSEFLASTDNWFRPVQVRTGPDGALYVVDMYRFLIEHPRWIPGPRLAKIDVRAGADMGRIYRVCPEKKPLRPIQDLTRLDAPALAAALGSPNGTERDRVQVELLQRHDLSAVPALKQLAANAALPQARLQALSALDGLGALDAVSLSSALADAHERVRAGAVRHCERFLSDGTPLSGVGAVPLTLIPALLSLTNDASLVVARQLAFTLGQSADPRMGQALAHLTQTWARQREIRTAILSSSGLHGAGILAAVARLDLDASEKARWIEPMIAVAAGSKDRTFLNQALLALLASAENPPALSQFAALATLLGALETQGQPWREYFSSKPELRDAQTRLNQLLEAAVAAAKNDETPKETRAAVLDLIGRSSPPRAELEWLCDFLVRTDSNTLREATANALGRQQDPAVAERLLAGWGQSPPSARVHIVQLLLKREAWALQLLDAVKRGEVQPQEISPADRQRLVQHAHKNVQQTAAKLFPAQPDNSRSQAMEQYKEVLSLAGKADRGKAIFAAQCASCHALAGIGHAVGPDLAPLRSKEPEYWMKNILDPNAVVEPRYLAYEIETLDGQSLSGVIRSESASAVTLVAGQGLTEEIKRTQIRSLRASKLSLMPEGMEQVINRQDMADLLAFVSDTKVATPPTPSDGLLRDPVSIARSLMEPATSDSTREAVIKANPQFAAAIINEMTKDIPTGKPAEYDRIPLIWRVAISCGKRVNPEQIKEVLEVSLPEADQPLYHWQAVVIGGGIINGLSQRGQWPAEWLAPILKTDAALQTRWKRALDLAATMADDTSVPDGTRYDALRMLGVEPWEKRGGQLAGYLAKGTNAELQMGAVSGLGDMQSPQATAALVKALDYLTKGNRDLALAALLRDDSRAAALLDCAETHGWKSAALGTERAAKLLEHPDPNLRARARKVLMP